MFTRTIGSLLRGSAAPMQLLLACVMGALIGFVPGAREHPGLLLFHVLLLVVLNANLGLALGVAGLAKLVSLLAMPASFALGRWLIEGPARGFFTWAVEAPGLALLHLDVYVVSGGMLIAVVLGLVAGLALVTSLQATRRKLVKLEEGSDKYKAATSKPWMRFLIWVLLGKKKKGRSYADLLALRFGKPYRLVGVVLVALLGVAVWLSPTLLGGKLMAAATRAGLEDAHGATVDVGGVILDLGEGRLTVDGLAMADPDNLGTDLLRAVRVEADGSMADLLRGRVALDTLVLEDSAQGLLRETPGRLIGGPREPTPAPAPEPDEALLDSGTLASYLEQGEELEQRLRQARQWLDEFSFGADEASEGVPGETLEQRLLREIEELGYGRVRAEGLRRHAPALLIRELLAGGMSVAAFSDERFDLHAWNLSTDPALVPESARITLTSRAGTLDLELGLGGATRPAADNRVRLAWHGLSGDRVGALLGGGRLSGGTLDVDLDGTWDGNRVGWLDLPVYVTLHGVTVDLVGGPRQVDELRLTFGVRGPLDNPRISFDDEQLREALLASARAELEGAVDAKAAELQAQADEAAAKAKAQVDAKQKELEDKADSVLDEKAADVKKKLGGLFGGKKKDDG